MALSSLRPRYHALVFTVDASLWLGFIISSGGTHRFWPCSVNILEHSGCSGGSPGALYLNNIIYLYIYNIYYHGEKLCAPPDDIMNLKRLRRVLQRIWFLHFHINLKYRLTTT